MLTIGKTKLTLFVYFYYFGQVIYFTEFGEDARLWKRIQILSVWQKMRIRHKSFSTIQSAGIKNWLGSQVNKLSSKTQKIFSFRNKFLSFVGQNKICMIRIMTQKVLHNLGNIFWMVIFRQYCQKSYLEPNQEVCGGDFWWK